MTDERTRSFRYWLRGLATIGLVALVVWVVAEQPGWLDELDLDQAPSWLRYAGLALTVAGGLVLLLLPGDPPTSPGSPQRRLGGLPRVDGHGWEQVVRWVWLAVAVATVLMLASRTSTSGGAPSIVRVELEANRQASEWFDEIRSALSHDWLFVPAYVTLIAVVVVWTGGYYRLAFMRRLREPLAWAVVVAGALDWGENALLWQATAHADRVELWRLTAVAAWGKFAVLAAATAYLVGGAHSWVATPSWLRCRIWELEGEQIQTERYRWNRDESSGYLGIALSGGGIRAASISLGALQCLELDQNAPASGLGWGSARVVTAISGGSNMAAGWSITRSQVDEKPALGAAAGEPGYPKRDASVSAPGQTDPLPWAYYLRWRGKPKDDPSHEEQHLMENLGYLASNAPRGDRHDPAHAPTAQRDLSATPAQEGVADSREPSRTQVLRPSAYASVLAGLGVNAAVLFGAFFLLAKPAGWALQGINGKPVSSTGLHEVVSTYWLGGIGPSYLAVGIVCLLVWIVLGQTSSSRVEEAGLRASAQRILLSSFKWLSYGALGLGAALSVALWALPELANLVSGIELTAISVATIGSAAGVVGAVVRILRKPAVARFAPIVGGVAFGALLVFLVCLWIAGSATEPITWTWSSWNSPAVWLAVAVALILVQLLVSPERWSLAAFYRGKLRLAYATRRTDRFVEPYRNDNVTRNLGKREPYLHAFRARRADDVNSGYAAPTTPLVICASATVSSRAVRTHRGVPALSVTFDPDHVTVYVPQDDRGKCGQYTAKTEHINALGEPRLKRLTPMLAAAASSAAVSPAMGRFRIGPTSMLLTFANLRLGVWLPNPRYAQDALPEGNKKLSFPTTGLSYLAKEFLGIHDLSDPYLYVTDGGHWENTGLVEMLRRPDIREIVCVDADSGPGDALSSLGKALELAPLECNVRVWINLDPMRAKTRASEHSPAYADRTVNIGFFTRDRDVASTGILWYCKPGLAANLYQNLLGFAELHSDFPHASTLNQFFDTATFAAYRDLGRFNAREILKARATLLELVSGLRDCDESTIRDQIKAKTADPDCHWVIREFDQALTHRPGDRWTDFVRAIHRVLTRPEARRDLPRDDAQKDDQKDEIGLCLLAVSDAREMAAVLADPELYRVDGGSPPTEEELRLRYARQIDQDAADDRRARHHWVVRVNGDAAGHVEATVQDKRAVVAWVFGTALPRQDVPAEAMRLLVQLLVARGVETIDSYVEPGRTSHERVAADAGFKPTDERTDQGERRWTVVSDG